MLTSAVAEIPVFRGGTVRLMSWRARPVTAVDTRFTVHAGKAFNIVLWMAKPTYLMSYGAGVIFSSKLIGTWVALNTP